MITPAPRGDAPFSRAGVQRDDRGIGHYQGLPSSLVAMFADSVRRYPDAEALVELGEHPKRLSFQQLWDGAASVAGGLVETGVRPGDRVANLHPAGVNWVLGFLGTQLAGAVAVPVNTRFAQPEIDYVISDSGAVVVLRPSEPLPAGPPHAHHDLGLSDLAAIFYTSGTTGFPKGALTSQENFLANIETALRVIDVDHDAGPAMRGLISVPLFHSTGCNSQLLVHLAIGGASVVLPTFNVADFLRAIVDERINLLTTVPAIYALAVSRPEFAELDVSGVSRVCYGGAPIAPALVHRLQDAFPNARVGNGFGLTETSSISTFLPHEWAAEHADSVGFAAPIVDLAVHEPDAAGVGEVLIRGANVVRGYWNKPEASAETFVDGWLHTGDLGRIDGSGLLYIVDRAKDMI
ncbi:MAG TPA: AMP-binding protein, partial [Pseudonocardia sp.]